MNSVFYEIVVWKEGSEEFKDSFHRLIQIVRRAPASCITSGNIQRMVVPKPNRTCEVPLYGEQTERGSRSVLFLAEQSPNQT